MNVEGEKSIHDAETDSFNTMLALKEMIETLNEPLEFLIELYPETKNESKDYEIKPTIENEKRKKERQLSKFCKIIKQRMLEIGR